MPGNPGKLLNKKEKRIKNSCMYDSLYTRMEWHDVTNLANLIGLNQTTK